MSVTALVCPVVEKARMPPASKSSSRVKSAIWVTLDPSPAVETTTPERCARRYAVRAVVQQADSPTMVAS